MKVLREIFTLIYAGAFGMLLLLFFCLVLDVFCGLLFGWNPLVGTWPIFSGTVSAFVYGEVWLILVLLIGIAGSTRFALGKREIYLIEWLIVSISDGQPLDSE